MSARRPSIAIAVAALILVGCTREPTGTLVPRPTSSGATPTSAAHRPKELAAVTLKVDWRAEPKPWETTLRIPWGFGRNQLGIERFTGQAPIVPASFAVVPEGFWILDPGNRRIVLFNRTGDVVEEVGGVSQVASDLAVNPDGRPVIINVEPDHELRTAESGRLSAPIRLERLPYRLVQDVFGVSVFGLTKRQVWLYALDTNGNLDLDSPGAPLDSAQYLQLKLIDRAGTSHVVEFGNVWSRLFHLLGDGRPAMANATFGADLSIARNRVDFGLLMGSFYDYPPPRPLYHLSLSNEGKLLAYEKVEPSQVDITNQSRYFAIGHDGRAYQLWLGRDHVEIRVRPPS